MSSFCSFQNAKKIIDDARIVPWPCQTIFPSRRLRLAQSKIPQHFAGGRRNVVLPFIYTHLYLATPPPTQHIYEHRDVKFPSLSRVCGAPYAPSPPLPPSPPFSLSLSRGVRKFRRCSSLPPSLLTSPLPADSCVCVEGGRGWVAAQPVAVKTVPGSQAGPVLVIGASGALPALPSCAHRARSSRLHLCARLRLQSDCDIFPTWAICVHVGEI